MKFVDIFKKVTEDGLRDTRNIVNKIVGTDYRDIYFTEYPNGPYVCKGCGKSLEHGQMSVPLIILFHENTEVQII